MTSSPRKPDRWPLLLPGDLPPPELVAREPRLAGLEENPVFRLMLFRDHRKRHRSWVDLSSLMTLGFLPACLLTFALGLPGYGISAWAYLIACWMLFGAQPGVFLGFWLSIPPEGFTDVWLTGISPAQITQATWGSFLLPETLSHRRLSGWIAAAGSFALLLLVSRSAQLPHLWIGLTVPLAWGAAAIGLAGYLPYSVLPMAALLIQGMNWHSASAHQDSLIVWKLKTAARDLFGVATFFGFAAMILIPQLCWALALPYLGLSPEFKVYALIPISAALAFLEGLAFGVIRGRRSRCDADEWLSLMAKEAGEAMLTRLRGATGEDAVRWSMTRNGAGSANKARAEEQK